jgi:hypothetical protein
MSSSCDSSSFGARFGTGVTGGAHMVAGKNGRQPGTGRYRGAKCKFVTLSPAIRSMPLPIDCTAMGMSHPWFLTVSWRFTTASNATNYHVLARPQIGSSLDLIDLCQYQRPKLVDTPGTPRFDYRTNTPYAVNLACVQAKGVGLWIRRIAPSTWYSCSSDQPPGGIFINRGCHYAT